MGLALLLTDHSRAALDVANVSQFILNEAQAVIKKIVSQYPYESHHEDGNPEEPSLKTESSALQKKLVRLLQKSANQAGVIIHSFQFNELSYAPEIAAGMLRRQQARAMLAARKVRLLCTTLFVY
jgi:membrane protease subunit (stomatin/prohibitin family)